MEIKITTHYSEMCECGRLYKSHIDKEGKKVCPACLTGMTVEELEKMWSTPSINLMRDK